jgi:hypothetical protein
MPRSPSIVPEESDRDVYLVLEDFLPFGRAWRETDDGDTDRVTLIRYLLEGQYENPIRIDRGELSASIEEFIQEHATRKPARQLSFAI